MLIMKLLTLIIILFVNSWHSSCWHFKSMFNLTHQADKLDFSVDGRLLAATSISTNAVFIYQTIDYILQFTYKPTTGGNVFSARFTKDGKFLAIAHSNGIINLVPAKAPFTNIPLQSFPLTNVIYEIDTSSFQNSILVCYLNLNSFKIMYNYTSVYTYPIGTTQLGCKFSSLNDVVILGSNNKVMTYSMNGYSYTLRSQVVANTSFTDIAVRKTIDTPIKVIIGGGGATNQSTASWFLNTGSGGTTVTSTTLIFYITPTSKIKGACYSPNSLYYAFVSQDAKAWLFEQNNNNNTQYLNSSQTPYLTCAFDSSSDILLTSTVMGMNSVAYIYIYSRICPNKQFESNNSCVLCSISIQGCEICQNSTFCKSCREGYFRESNTCFNCNLFNFNCLSCTSTSCTRNAYGCVSPFNNINGSSYCLACNTSNMFKLFPNFAGDCDCISHYQLKGDICSDICGDGLIMTSSPNGCDDNNIIDGDGCSSECKQEVGYLCTNGSNISPSICTYIASPLKVSLHKIYRNYGRNQGVFQFDVVPPLLNLGRMKFSQFLALTCNSNYIISQINYIQGRLQIIADYKSAMEGNNCTLELSFDISIIKSPTVFLNFEAVSSNTPLTLSQNIQIFFNFGFIFNIISYAALALFILSLPTKMIGVQTVVCCQLVYVSQCFYNPHSFLFSSIKQFQLMTGHLSLFPQQSTGETLFSFNEGLSFSYGFYESNIVVISTLLLFFLIFMICVVFQKCLDQKQIQKKNRIKCLYYGIASKLLYNIFIFPLSAGFFIVFSFTNYFECLRNVDHHSSFSIYLNLSLKYLTYLILSSVFCYQFKVSFNRNKDQKKKQPQNQKSKLFKKQYGYMFFIRLLAISLCIESGLYLNFDVLAYIISGLTLQYILIVIIFRPYFSIFHSFGVICGQLTVMYSFFLALFQRFISLEQTTQIFLIFVLEGMLILTVLVNTIRVVLFYVQLCLKDMKKESVLQTEKDEKNKIDDNLISTLLDDKEGNGSIYHLRRLKVFSNKEKLSNLNKKYEEEEELVLKKKSLKLNFANFKKKIQQMSIQQEIIQ